MSMRVAASNAYLLVFFSLVFVARAQEAVIETKLLSDAGLHNVAIEGDFIASAPSGWDQERSVAILRKTGSRWHDGASETVIQLSGVPSECCRPFRLAIQIPYLFVSTLAVPEPQGQVHVFRLEGQSWIATQKLVIPNAWDSDSVPLAADKDVLVAGSNHEAYVFRHDGGEWHLEAKLEPPGGGVEDFGEDAVAVVGDVVVVGSEFPDGSAHVFHHTAGQWQHRQRLDYPDYPGSSFPLGGSFGRSVQMNESWLAIGAPEDAEGGRTAGAIFIYRDVGEGFSLAEKITSPFEAEQGHNGASLGNRMVMSGNVIADFPYYSTVTKEVGVLLYRRDASGWAQLPSLRPTASSATLDWAGGNQPAVDASRSVLVVADPEGNALYVYENLPGVSVGAQDELTTVPLDYHLDQNYPNPFNPTTTISYDLPRTSDATLTIFDVLGKQIKEIASGSKPAGSYEVSFDATGIPSGIYFYRLQAGDYVETRRMVVVK